MLKKSLLIILIGVAIWLLAGCGPSTPSEGSQTLYVAPSTVECQTEAGAWACLLVKESPDAEWQQFSDSIDGFTYEPGYFYELIVTQRERENAPDDVATTAWELQKVVNQAPAVVKRIQIGPEQIECTGEAPQFCYQVREDPASDWQLFYDEIQGFTFEPGFVTTMQVAETEIADPPADASSLAWTLLTIESQELVSAEGTGGETAVSGDAAAVPTEFVPVTVEEIGVQTAVPADWPQIEDDPLITYGWGPDQFTFVAFNAAPGEDARQAIAELVGVEQPALTDGSLAGEYTEMDVNGRAWVIYTQEDPDIQLSQTAAITEQDGTVYLVSLFLEGLPKDAILEPVLENFALVSLAEGVAGETMPDVQPVITAAPTLTNVEWVLTTLQDAGLLEGTRITAVFGPDGQITGNSGCNEYFGPFTTDETTLSAGPLAATRRACETEIDNQEAAYLNALEAAGSYQVDGSQLTINAADGQALLVYTVEQPLVLQNIIWVLREYQDFEGQMQPTLEGAEATAVFGSDNTLSGSGGCNTFASTYTIEGSQLSIGLPVATLSNCPEPAGIMEQETFYLANLVEAATYAVDAQTLSLLDSAGNIRLAYEPQP